jgi:type VI secretion system protein ImpK
VPPAPPPPPPEPDLVDRIRVFLAPEIQQRLVVVEGDAQRLMIRIAGRGMFPSGSSSVEAAFLPLLNRIGEALRAEGGRVTVLGQSDNQPIRTVRFPSNFALSAARAEAAKDIMAAANGQPARFTAIGRADTEPLVPNTTPDGRETNRRIEVVLIRERR